ncbi:hypothetical protein CHELA41_23830 [Hyphomicrobiales bacterium]|nr:hypothetical protein CHELA41_23830 [Hyphomicrobiales bacterium]
MMGWECGYVLRIEQLALEAETARVSGDWRRCFMSVIRRGQPWTPKDAGGQFLRRPCGAHRKPVPGHGRHRRGPGFSIGRSACDPHGLRVRNHPV